MMVVVMVSDIVMFNPYLGMIGPSDSYASSGLKTSTSSIFNMGSPHPEELVRLQSKSGPQVG